MVGLDVVRASNRSLKASTKNITALFIGGTSGIGRSALRQLALNVEKPTIYVVGRKQASAEPLAKDVQALNPAARLEFIEGDVSLIKNIDQICDQIRSKEDHFNLLFMTPGGISLVGRRDTSEGLDRLFALRYYSRMRFIQNLLPLLSAAPPSTPSSVVSVFGGGFELPIDTSDLDLRRSYSLYRCAAHSITMTSLSMAHLAEQNPRVSFVHTFPGIVRTNIYNNSFPAPVAAFYNYAMWPLMWPFSTNVEESGERNLYHATSETFANRNVGNGSDSSSSIGIGSDGAVGSGSYLVGQSSTTKAGSATFQKYLRDGYPETIWKHTTDLLDQCAK